jgi:hypothetical protein
LLLAKCRPYDRKLKTGAPLVRAGGQANIIGASSIWSPATRITGPVSLILMSWACGRSSSLWWLGIVRSRACISFRCVLLVVVAHVSHAIAGGPPQKSMQPSSNPKDSELQFRHGVEKFRLEFAVRVERRNWRQNFVRATH